MGWASDYLTPDTTEKEFSKVAQRGGRINTTFGECWIFDCDEARPHYHIVCRSCGCVDLLNTDCGSCNLMRETMRIQGEIERWKEDNWKVLLLGRILVVVILFTIAVWKGGTT